MENKKQKTIGTKPECYFFFFLKEHMIFMEKIA